MTHKIRCVLAACALMVGSPLLAQTLRVEVPCDPSAVAGFEFYAAPMSHTGGTPVRLVLQGRQLSGDLPEAADGLYNLYGASGSMQVQVPFFVPKGAKKARLRLSFRDKCPQLGSGADNAALSAYNYVVWNRQREVWMKADVMTPELLGTLLKSYRLSADSVLQRYRTTPSVSRYIRLWADQTAYVSFSMAGRGMKRTPSAGPLKFTDLYPVEVGNMDTEMAFYFSSGARCLMAALRPQPQLGAMMDEVGQSYRNRTVRTRLYDHILNNYLSRFDYAADYANGLATVRDVVSRYGLSEDYVKQFESHKSTIGGQPFPTSAKLVDAEGRPVDFGNLKGYYVYIDLWASWCVPCRKETPYLQRLGKELKNPLVKIVSISIDRTEQPWKKAMAQLGSDGLQWLNADNSLAEALNIKGIPFFLIYDRNGKLLKYDAPRPSEPQLKACLENLK
ncbi:MAG: TlpA family protein disulfide reductase [Prevotella sp.]|nr:TlpA family protein disulfide reductase [Prevotella sp.]